VHGYQGSGPTVLGGRAVADRARRPRHAGATEKPSSDVRNGGKIAQWACNSSGDSYQRWWFSGSGQYNTNGNANAGLHNAGSGTCLDAEASDVGQNGTIFQWACSGSDHFQLWN
jgi:hypothetical protein